MIQFQAEKITIDAQTPEGLPSRSIMGLAAPYNVVAEVNNGQKVRFLSGAFDTTQTPKLIMNHDMTQLVGKITELVNTEQGLLFTARFSKTRDAEDALQLALDEVLDSVSVGAEPIEATYDDAGVLNVSKANLIELSLVPTGAFSSAKITQVAASEPEKTQELEIPKTELQPEEQNKMEIEAEKPAEVTAPIFAEAKRPLRMPSPAEYIAAFYKGGDTFHNINAAIAENNRYNFAAGDVTTTDYGALPVPVVQPVYTNISYLRPVMTAIGARAMPTGSGTTFNRPSITTHTSVAQQMTELSALSSTTMVVTDNAVTKKTFGGTALVSEQSIDWGDPSSINIVLQDLAGQYADATDNYCADQITANATVLGTWNGNASSLVADIYSAAGAINSSTNVQATHLFVAPNVFQKIGGLVDGSNRPLFPTVAPYNASGTQSAASWNGNPLGLTMVVDKNFAANTMIVACAAGAFAGFEIYEQQKGAITLEQPEVLGRRVSFRGYLATLMIDATKFQSINYSA